MEWISVKDRLPPKAKVSVLTHEKESGLTDIQDVQEIQNVQCWCHNRGYIAMSDSKVTHWMELPLPPT